MPRPKITLRAVERIAALQCTYREAGAFFDISGTAFKNLLDRDPRAEAAWDRGKGRGHISLRRKQLRLASSNATMAIWLGKQYLKQDEVTKHEHSGKDGGPIPTTTIDVSKLDEDERKALRSYLLRTMRSEEPD